VICTIVNPTPASAFRAATRLGDPERSLQDWSQGSKRSPLRYTQSVALRRRYLRLLISVSMRPKACQPLLDDSGPACLRIGPRLPRSSGRSESLLGLDRPRNWRSLGSCGHEYAFNKPLRRKPCDAPVMTATFLLCSHGVSHSSADGPDCQPPDGQRLMGHT